MRIVSPMKSPHKNAARVPVNITMDTDVKRLATTLAETNGENLSEMIERLLLADAGIKPPENPLRALVNKRLAVMTETNADAVLARMHADAARGHKPTKREKRPPTSASR